MFVKKWTDEEVQFIKDNVETLSKTEMANILGRSNESVSSRISKLRRKGELKRKNRLGIFTPECEKYLMDNIHTLTVGEIASDLNLQNATIRYWMQKLGIEYEREYEYKTEVVIKYTKNGFRRTKVLIVNEFDYAQACRRVLDLATNMMGFSDVKVVG